MWTPTSVQTAATAPTDVPPSPPTIPSDPNPKPSISDELIPAAHKYLNSQLKLEVNERLELYTYRLLLAAKIQCSRFSYGLDTPVETTHGTRTFGGALLYTGLLFVVFCRPGLASRAATEWMNLTNRPVRWLTFGGLSAHYFNPQTKVQQQQRETVRIGDHADRLLRKWMDRIKVCGGAY